MVQVGLSGRLGDEGLIWERFGKFWGDVVKDVGKVG